MFPTRSTKRWFAVPNRLVSLSNNSSQHSSR